MSELRAFATSKFNAICPDGNVEAEFYRIIQNRVSSGKGVAFYPFRRLYKRHLNSFLSNYATNDAFRGRVSNNREELIKALECPDSRYWLAGHDDLELHAVQEEDGELREGQFACGNCARKGKYARNTTHIELQTRSSDEPTTLFVKCRTCGKTYRFSS